MMNATFSRRQFEPGNVAISSQSGAVGLAVIDEASQRGLGLSAFVSVGNKADVSSNDLLEYWEDDPETAAIALYLESFGNPRRFARIANRVARRKPILALKSGSTTMGERAALSHTAALAGSDQAAEALFRQAGVIRAHTLQELCDVLQLSRSSRSRTDGASRSSRTRAGSRSCAPTRAPSWDSSSRRSTSTRASTWRRSCPTRRRWRTPST